MHPFCDKCPIWKLERPLYSYLRVPFKTKSWRMRFARKSNALVSLWKSEPVCRALWKLAFRWSAWRACRTLLCESMRACRNKKRWLSLKAMKSSKMSCLPQNLSFFTSTSKNRSIQINHIQRCSHWGTVLQSEASCTDMEYEVPWVAYTCPLLVQDCRCCCLNISTKLYFNHYNRFILVLS